MNAENHNQTDKYRFVGERKCVALGDLCALVMGQSPSSDSYNGAGEGLPFFQGNADFGEVTPTPRVWCTNPKKIAERGSILISVRAPIGAINIAEESCCIGRGVAAIQPNQNLLSVGFLKYQLIALREKLELMGTGSTFKAVGKKSLNSLPIFIYPKNVQTEIERQFDTVARQISTARQQISCLDDLVKSRFVEMFGRDTRLECWPLRKCCSSVVGGMTPSMRHPEYYGGNIPFIKSGDVKEENISSGTLWLTEEALAKTTAKLVPKGSVIVVTRSGILKHTLPVAIASASLVINQDIKALQPVEGFTSEYLAWSIRSNESFLLGQTRAMTVDNIETEALLNAPVPNAPIEEQGAFTAFVQQVDKLRFAIQEQIEKLEMLKASLMQEYFG